MERRWNGTEAKHGPREREKGRLSRHCKLFISRRLAAAEGAKDGERERADIHRRFQRKSLSVGCRSQTSHRGRQKCGPGGGGLDLAAGAPLFVCVFMAGVLLKLLLLL